MVNIESKLLKALEQSTCFGIAHDDTIPECKQCDVKGQCKSKVEGANVPTPKTKPVKESSVNKTVGSNGKPSTTSKPSSNKTNTKANTSSTKPAANKPASKPENKPQPSGNLPDFKSMGLQDLISLAKEKNVEWKDYGNDNITRMRLIMSLKKCY